ncbi:MAG: shikimate kinase [Planctomycetota bacterium]|nr:shikimate kinase [Planctomycetota bacterium]
MSKHSRKIALIGLRASGKSSVGKALAARMNLDFVDLDQEIVARADVSGLDSCGEVLIVLGEPSFRAVETACLRAVCERSTELVIATGGGAIEASENRALLAQHTTSVWLKVGVPILQARLRAELSPRPPLLGKSTVDEVPVIAARRNPLYAEAADFVLSADVGDPDVLAERILVFLGERGGSEGSSR